MNHPDKAADPLKVAAGLEILADTDHQWHGFAAMRGAASLIRQLHADVATLMEHSQIELRTLDRVCLEKHRLEEEVARLRAGKFTAEEVNEISQRAFTDGRIAEKSRLTSIGLNLEQNNARLAKFNASLTEESARLATDLAKERAENALHRAKATGEYWAWQGDGEYHLESLTCPVLIPAEVLRKLHEENADLRRLAEQNFHELKERLGIK